MSTSAKRKERQRHKRQEKRTALMRAQSGSVYRRAGAHGEVVACYLNRNWRESGLASIHVLRRVPGGGLALGAFLVDIWCLGLKDAWGRLDITMEQFREMMDRYPAEADLVRVDVGVAQRLVAGGIRFARQNSFRLPAKYERWTALLGEIPDPASADLSDFSADGKLCYVGEMEDLRRRLVRRTPQEFLQQPGLEFIVGPDADPPARVDETQESFLISRERMLSDVRQWCFAQGLIPHPRLREVIEMSLASTARVMNDVEDDVSEEHVEAVEDAIADRVALEDVAAQQQLHAALEQLRGFTEQFKSPKAMAESLGIAGHLPS